MSLKPIKFKNEKTSYIAPTWKELNQLAFKISKQILKDLQGTSLKFDRIVTLAKGGWPMTRSMVDFLSVDKVASIGVKFYSGIYKKLKTPQIYQDLPINIKGERILLFDDVADTGESLIFVKKHLLKKGAKSITTATLLYKPWSKIKPDYFAHTTDTWIVFPYDAIAEAIGTIGNKWQQKGLSKTTIFQRFKQLNLPASWVKFYFK